MSAFIHLSQLIRAVRLVGSLRTFMFSVIKLYISIIILI